MSYFAKTAKEKLFFVHHKSHDQQPHGATDRKSQEDNSKYLFFNDLYEQTYLHVILIVCFCFNENTTIAKCVYLETCRILTKFSAH